ncbi:MAG: transketolase C-terminal domain-containing protein [Patescibacteria group bacterium]
MALTSLLHPDLFTKKQQLASTREGYGAGMLELCAKNPRVVVLTADLGESTKVEACAKAFPDRFIDVGVAEQNLIGISAGLALAGKIPFASSFAVFLPGRCWDQLRVSVCYANANAKFIGSHAGITTGPDGATHQALEDIALMRVLPNMTVLAPCDFEEARKATLALAKHKGPAYLRLTREKGPVIFQKTGTFAIGKNNVLLPGEHVTIAASGPLVYEALLSARLLAKKKIQAEVINCSSIKPFDTDTLVKSVKKTRCCVTVEDHQTTGGLFGVVAETLARSFPVPVEAIGMHDCFGESGQPQELLAKFGMTAEHIAQAALRVRERR